MWQEQRREQQAKATAAAPAQAGPDCKAGAGLRGWIARWFLTLPLLETFFARTLRVEKNDGNAFKR